MDSQLADLKKSRYETREKNESGKTASQEIVKAAPAVCSGLCLAVNAMYSSTEGQISGLHHLRFVDFSSLVPGLAGTSLWRSGGRRHPVVSLEPCGHMTHTFEWPS